jgi:hypothetical protein
MSGRKTNRGFRIYCDFADSYGNQVRVQESSSAEKYCAWIFCHKGPSSNMDEPSPHLTISQAKRVIRALEKFIAGK